MLGKIQLGFCNKRGHLYLKVPTNGSHCERTQIFFLKIEIVR